VQYQIFTSTFDIGHLAFDIKQLKLVTLLPGGIIRVIILFFTALMSASQFRGGPVLRKQGAFFIYRL